MQTFLLTLHKNQKTEPPLSSFQYCNIIPASNKPNMIQNHPVLAEIQPNNQEQLKLQSLCMHGLCQVFPKKHCVGISTLKHFQSRVTNLKSSKHEIMSEAESDSEQSDHDGEGAMEAETWNLFSPLHKNYKAFTVTLFLMKQLSQQAQHLRPKSKQSTFDSAVALFTEKVFYSGSLLVSSLNKIPSLVEIPSQPGKGVQPIV